MIVLMRSTPRLVRVSLYVLVAAVAIQVADPFLGLAKGELLTRVIEDWLYNGVLIGAALVCVARAVRVREERLAWALIGFGLVAWSAADLYYTLVLSKLDAPPYPSISDAGWLVFYPACWAAVVLLMRRRIREFHASLWLDGIVAALGVAARDRRARAAADPRHERGGRAVRRRSSNLAYPVGDVLLLVLMVGALALTGWRPDRPLALVGVGLVLSGAADIVLPQRDRRRPGRRARPGCRGCGRRRRWPPRSAPGSRWTGRARCGSKAAGCSSSPSARWPPRSSCCWSTTSIARATSPCCSPSPRSPSPACGSGSRSAST